MKINHILEYLSALSPHNYWHPHDLDKPVEERRPSDKVLKAIDLLYIEWKSEMAKELERIPHDGEAHCTCLANAIWKLRFREPS